jgi:hypothetical protein
MTLSTAEDAFSSTSSKKNSYDGDDDDDGADDGDGDSDEDRSNNNDDGNSLDRGCDGLAGSEPISYIA